MWRSLPILIVPVCRSLPLVATVPAAANSYPGLVERQWVHGNDVLDARIAIEVNAANEDGSGSTCAASGSTR